MCLPILGALMSVAGGLVTQSEQQANAKRQAEARNKVLDDTLKSNDVLATRSENEFKRRTDKTKPAAVKDDQRHEAYQRTTQVEKGVSDPNANAMDVPLSGSAPDVVRSSVAQKLLDVAQAGKAHAKAAGKLGSYGDSWFNQGLKDAATQRDLSVNSNYTAGNLGILSPKQDIMELRAYKPISPLGGILSGLGGMFGGG